MPQVTHGHYRGAPGPAGSPACIDFCDVVPPAQSTDPQVASSANGSTFSNVNGATGSTFYVKVAGVWTNLA